ncbi:MAG: diguanylate cyclase [Terracidiphilus sp.]|jgi:diguanylate cyclase (GGDEF)-like protein
MSTVKPLSPIADSKVEKLARIEEDGDGMEASRLSRSSSKDSLTVRAALWTACRIGLASLAASIFAAVPALGLNPNRNVDQYFHETWTSQRGLPGEAVYQILQSRDGYLWLRTSAGLVRFDGVRFILMDEVIGSEPVRAIAMGADGDLLIRTTSRTVIYKDGEFSDYLPAARLPDGDIREIFESRERKVFIGSDNFIYTAERDGLHLAKTDTSWINALIEDERGTVWIGGVYDLYAYRNGVVGPALKAKASGEISALAEDYRHTIWVGTPHGLFRVASDGASLEPTSFGILRGGAGQILEDRQRNLWVGTPSSGLVRITAGLASSFQFSDGLSDNRIHALFEDREGSLWVGTASGLDRFRNTKVTTLTVKEGLPDNQVATAISARDGSIYTLAYSAGLARIENDRVVSVTKEIPGLGSIRGVVLFEARDGGLWIGAVGGLTEIKNGKMTVYKSDPRLTRFFITALSEDDEGLLAATAEQLVVRVKDGRALPFTVHGKTTPLTVPGLYTFTIYRQPSGVLWFGTEKGLFKYAPGTIPALQPGIDFPVTSISDDEHGNLWLGGRTPGLTRLRVGDGKVTHYSKRDGLFDVYPARALSDGDGNLWISTSNGIYRAREKDLDDFANGRIPSVPSTVFGITDGMKTSEVSSTDIGSQGCKGPDGKLWFTTVSGIVWIDPTNLLENGHIPPVAIESVEADDLQFSPHGEIQIPASKDKIEFHYTALSLLVPERVRFKYRLEGYDHDWVDAGTRRVAYYNNLHPGKYRFQVIAENDDGLWNMDGASSSFTLKPHYYQTSWFYSLCSLAAIALVIGLLRYNTRRLRAQADELTRMVDERTKKLQLEVIERQRAEEAAVEAREKMRFQATHDVLTSFLNRGAILDVLARELSRAARERTSITVLMADLDHFKDINDKYGHIVGDEVLREVARRLTESVRPYDSVGRYGGEEFLLVLSNCDAETAMERANELRGVIASAPVKTSSGSIKITTSMGVLASRNWNSSSPDDVLRKVDSALYAAKEAGRNRCCMAVAA